MTPGTTVAVGATIWFSSVQFRSVTQSCPTLCDPMNLIWLKLVKSTIFVSDPIVCYTV